MSLFLLLNPKQFGDSIVTVVGGGPGGWLRHTVARRKKKQKDYKEVLLKYLRGEGGTQEQIEVEVNVSFDRVVAALSEYDKAQIAKEKERAIRRLSRLTRAKEASEAIDAARVIEKFIKDKRTRRQRDEEEEFILLSLFEDDL